MLRVRKKKRVTYNFSNADTAFESNDECSDIGDPPKKKSKDSMPADETARESLSAISSSSKVIPPVTQVTQRISPKTIPHDDIDLLSSDEDTDNNVAEDKIEIGYACISLLSKAKLKIALEESRINIDSKADLMLPNNIIDYVSKLQDHESMHSCPKCEFKTLDYYKILSHVLRHKVWLCRFCCKSFDRIMPFKYHVQTHTAECGFYCSECKISRLKKGLEKHISEVHDDASIKPCTYEIHRHVLYGYLCHNCGLLKLTKLLAEEHQSKSESCNKMSRINVSKLIKQRNSNYQFRTVINAFNRLRADRKVASTPRRRQEAAKKDASNQIEEISSSTTTNSEECIYIDDADSSSVKPKMAVTDHKPCDTSDVSKTLESSYESPNAITPGESSESHSNIGSPTGNNNSVPKQTLHDAQITNKLSETSNSGTNLAPKKKYRSEFTVLNEAKNQNIHTVELESESEPPLDIVNLNEENSDEEKSSCVDDGDDSKNDDESLHSSSLFTSPASSKQKGHERRHEEKLSNSAKIIDKPAVQQLVIPAFAESEDGIMVGLKEDKEDNIPFSFGRALSKKPPKFNKNRTVSHNKQNNVGHKFKKSSPSQGAQSNHLKSSLPEPYTLDITEQLPLQEADVNPEGDEHSNHHMIQCPQCNQVRNFSKSSFTMHLFEHYNINTYMCGLCNQRFFDQSSIDVHALQEHQRTSVPFCLTRCPDHINNIVQEYFCDKLQMNDAIHDEPPKLARFDSTLESDENDNSHNEVTNTIIQCDIDDKNGFKCPICRHKHESKIAILLHLKRDHFPKYKCGICNLLMGFKFDVERHAKHEHGGDISLLYNPDFDEAKWSELYRNTFDKCHHVEDTEKLNANRGSEFYSHMSRTSQMESARRCQNPKSNPISSLSVPKRKFENTLNHNIPQGSISLFELTSKLNLDCVVRISKLDKELISNKGNLGRKDGT